MGRGVNFIRACSSVVERCPDKTEAVGPIPTTPTWKKTKVKIIKDYTKVEYGGSQRLKFLVKFLPGLQSQ